MRLALPAWIAKKQKMRRGPAIRPLSLAGLGLPWEVKAIVDWQFVCWSASHSLDSSHHLVRPERVKQAQYRLRKPIHQPLGRLSVPA